MQRHALAGLDPSTVPGSAAEVARYYESMQPALRVYRDSAEALMFLTAPPVPWKLNPALRVGLELGGPRLAYLGVASTALGLLPPWARRLYGGLGLPIAGATAGLSARAIRAALAALPDKYVQGPIYRGAMARAAAASAV